MQLRVARLCLDCEELHIENACPVCASARYAFLAAWLPSEERRKWKLASPSPADTRQDGAGAVIKRVAEWFGGEPPSEEPTHPRTRASDHVPAAAFEELADQPAMKMKKKQKPRTLKPRPAKTPAP